MVNCAGLKPKELINYTIHNSQTNKFLLLENVNELVLKLPIFVYNFCTDRD